MPYVTMTRNDPEDEPLVHVAPAACAQVMSDVVTGQTLMDLASDTPGGPGGPETACVAWATCGWWWVVCNPVMAITGALLAVHRQRRPEDVCATGTAFCVCPLAATAVESYLS